MDTPKPTNRNRQQELHLWHILILESCRCPGALLVLEAHLAGSTCPPRHTTSGGWRQSLPQHRGGARVRLFRHIISHIPRACVGTCKLLESIGSEQGLGFVWCERFRNRSITHRAHHRGQRGTLRTVGCVILGRRRVIQRICALHAKVM